jgi:hypothetical protein
MPKSLDPTIHTEQNKNMARRNEEYISLSYPIKQSPPTIAYIRMLFLSVT